MTLQEIFNQLSYGELSQLAIGKQINEETPDARWPQLIGHVNLGLTSLFKRFALKESRVMLALQPGQLLYSLNSQYALSNTRSTAPVKYLIDTEEKFTDSLLKVERVYSQAGCQLELNDLSDLYSVTTPSMTSLRVPADIANNSNDLPDYIKGTKLEIVYRADHPRIGANQDPSRVHVELPDSHLQALLYFIASRVHNPIGMAPQMEFNAGNNWNAKYEAECLRLTNDGMQIDNGNQHHKLHAKGWI